MGVLKCETKEYKGKILDELDQACANFCQRTDVLCSNQCRHMPCCKWFNDYLLCA